jgi:isopentenyl phosphate kinase
MEEVGNFRNAIVVSCKDYEKISNVVWKCLQLTNMVDEELEKQGVFVVFHTPLQSLNKLSIDLERLKENIEHVALLNRICAINP